MSVQYLANLCWYSLDLGVVQPHVKNGGTNLGSLGQFNDAVSEFLDTNSNIISQVALIFNRQLEVMQLVDDVMQLLVRWSQEDSIVDLDNEIDVIPVKDTIVNK